MYVSSFTEGSSTSTSVQYGSTRRTELCGKFLFSSVIMSSSYPEKRFPRMVTFLRLSPQLLHTTPL